MAGEIDGHGSSGRRRGLSAPRGGRQDVCASTKTTDGTERRARIGVDLSHARTTGSTGRGGRGEGVPSRGEVRTDVQKSLYIRAAPPTSAAERDSSLALRAVALSPAAGLRDAVRVAGGGARRRPHTVPTQQGGNGIGRASTLRLVHQDIL